MKHFTITTQEQAEALRPYYCNTEGSLMRPTIGERVTPSANHATVTSWDDYPEEDAITFEECMAIVRDEVTEEVWSELKDGTKGGASEIRFAEHCSLMDAGEMVLIAHHYRVPNMTATKLRLLVAILRGELPR